MPKLLGIDIPNNKHINVSLTYLYGIGPASADKICAMAGIDPMLKAGDLTDANITAILQILQEHTDDETRMLCFRLTVLAMTYYTCRRHRQNYK